MNRYNEWLNLNFDPFAPGAASRDFYCSGHRQQLLDQIVELSLYSNAMIAVTGPLGAGKTTLAANFCEQFSEEAVCIRIAATLFMNQGQFLESLQAGLPFKTSPALDSDGLVEQICQYAAELDLEARSLILIIDDAHELSADVLQLLMQLLERSVDSSIHALLFGESQLDHLLQSTLSAEAQERLAVFSLEGFGSDETYEYVRFKLVTAGYSKDMPLAGGIIGSIHNSSQGMPGAINNLVADALNSAAPRVAPTISTSTEEPEDFGPMFGGERIEQLEEDESPVRSEEENPSALPDWLPSIQPGYWAAAATLVVLLAGTLLFWDAAPREIESAPIAVAVTPTAAQSAAPLAARQIDAPDLASTDEEQLPSAPREEPATTVPAPANPVVAIETAETAATADPVSSESVAPTAEPPSEIVQQRADPAPQPKTSVLTQSTAFEERLLRAAPGNYVVQLLASHSEANIQRFVAEIGGDQKAGYFETRHQGKPWFVAVLAAFDDRSQATEAISALPEKLRSNQPWIRSIAGVQTDIRELLNSKLVSSQ